MANESPAAVIVDPITEYTAKVDEQRRVLVAASGEGQAIPIEVNLSGGPPSDLSTIVRQVLESGGSDSLLVDGSTTPVVFEFVSDPTYDIKLYEVRFIVTGQDFTLDGDSFGGAPGLTNGVKVSVVAGAVEVEMAVIKANEDWFLVPFAEVAVDVAGPKDYMVLAQKYSGVVTLEAGGTDRVKVTIRDDLTINNQINRFQVVVLGVKVMS